jgi:hypothetical protein
VGEANALVPLLDVPDAGLARAAAAALGALKDRRTLPELWERALLARGPAARMALVALRAFVVTGGLPDDARLLRGARFDIDGLLDGLSQAPEGSAAELEALWSEHAGDVLEVLGRALQGGTAGTEPRRRALEALDGRDGGLALGPLTAAGVSPAGGAALQAMGERLRDRVAALLDDGDPVVRRLAVRVASKLHDSRLGLSHVQAMVTGPPAEGEAAALLATRTLLESGRVAPAVLVESLGILLADGSWERRLTVVRVLRLGGRAARPALQRAARDPNPFVRAEATSALSWALR